MLNRRASLEWNLQTIGMMILGVAALVGLAFMVVKLIALFTAGADDWRAGRNLMLLTDRVNAVRDQHLTGSEASVVIALPNRYALIGYDKGTGAYGYGIGSGATDKSISRPSECNNKACLCFVDTRRIGPSTMNQEIPKPNSCTPIDGIEYIRGTIGPECYVPNEGKFRLVQKESTGEKNLFLPCAAKVSDASKPVDIGIAISGTTLTIAPMAPTASTNT